MTRGPWQLPLGWLLCAVTLLPAQTSVSRVGKLPEAATVLDRYVEATGGANAYRKFSVEIVDMTVTAGNGQSAGVTIFRARDGRMRTVVDAGPASEQTGVTDGIPWKFSEEAGARLLTGKPAARQIALSRGFEEDTWREQFPQAVMAGEEIINGRKC